jgi:hypothetical protein
MTLVRRLWVIGFAVIVACATAPDTAPAQTAWDQAKVTAIAQELKVAGDGWWQALRHEGDDQDFVGSGDSQVYDDMLRESRTLFEQSEGLAGNLAGGKGRAETLDMYKSIKEIVDDMIVDEERAFLEAPTIAAWKKYSDLFKQITPYYTDAK